MCIYQDLCSICYKLWTQLSQEFRNRFGLKLLSIRITMIILLYSKNKIFFPTKFLEKSRYVNCHCCQLFQNLTKTTTKVRWHSKHLCWCAPWLLLLEKIDVLKNTIDEIRCILHHIGGCNGGCKSLLDTEVASRVVQQTSIAVSPGLKLFRKHRNHFTHKWESTCCWKDCSSSAKDLEKVTSGMASLLGVGKESFIHKACAIKINKNKVKIEQVKQEAG